MRSAVVFNKFLLWFDNAWQKLYQDHFIQNGIIIQTTVIYI